MFVKWTSSVIYHYLSSIFNVLFYFVLFFLLDFFWGGGDWSCVVKWNYLSINFSSGYGQKNVTRSECYSCHSMALAVSVRPPEARKDRKSRSRHSCNAPDCTHRSDRSTGNQPRSHGRQNAEYQGREYRGPRGYGGEEFVYGYGQYHGQVNTPGNFNGGKKHVWAILRNTRWRP